MAVTLCTMQARLLEPAPGFLDNAPAGDLLIRACADVAANGQFGERWVTVDASEIRVFDRDQPTPAARVPIQELKASRVEAHVGSGVLVLERFGKSPLRIPFSQSEGAKFAEVVRGIEQLRQGDPFHINGHVDERRCRSCRRLLPEPDGLCPACIRTSATLARLAVRLWPHKLRTVTVALASLFVTAAELAPPLVTALVVDEVLVPAEPAPPLAERLELLALLVGALVGIRVISWGAEWVHGWNATWLGARVTADIRAELYHRLEALSLPFYDKHPVGTLIARATRDVQMLQGFLIDGVPFLVTNLLMVVGILALMLAMSWSLGLYVLLPVPLVILWGVFYWSRLRTLFTRWMQAWGKLTERTVESLTGIRVVKAFAQERREIASFNAVNGSISAAAIHTRLHQGIFFATMALITGLGSLIVWGVGGQQVLGGTITLGTLVAFYTYLYMFLGPIQWFGQMGDMMSRAFASAERIFEIIDTKPEAAESDATIRPSLVGHVRFRDVTFGYDKSKPVLKGIDLDLAPGEMVGIVGRSGVGKTTIVNLIARFYDPDQGTVEIDGIDARDWDLHQLRSGIGMVLQEAMLFSGTIADNIGYGKPGASLAEIMDAARAANAHDFIMAKPDAYETAVGEKGTGLSGGERQRISIARAILRDPRILIFDEATASVDVETEKHIQAALARLMRGRTTIAIAHRLSTLRDASRIVVIEDGRIAEEGSHAELLAQRGTFHELLEMQRAASEIIAVAE